MIGATIDRADPTLRARGLEKGERHWTEKWTVALRCRGFLGAGVWNEQTTWAESLGLTDEGGRIEVSVEVGEVGTSFCLRKTFNLAALAAAWAMCWRRRMEERLGPGEGRTGAPVGGESVCGSDVVGDGGGGLQLELELVLVSELLGQRERTKSLRWEVVVKGCIKDENAEARALRAARKRKGFVGFTGDGEG